jgi:very-short-patch-repair endonuclease
MTTTPINEADLHASRQHGVVTHHQLVACGLSANQIQYMRRTGRLVPAHRGVYRVASTPESPEGDLTAALLAAGPRSFASHRTAAAIWKLPGFELKPTEVTSQSATWPRLDGVVVHRSPAGGPLDVVQHGIWRVSRPALTLLHLGAVVDKAAVEKACEFAVLTGLVRPDQLEVVLDRFGGVGCRGAATLRALLAERTAAPESELEWLLVGIVRRYCSFEPVLQHEVEISGKRYRLDLAAPKVKVSVEGVGRRWHDGKAAVEADTRRRTALTAAGWAVLEYRWADAKRRPKGIGGEIEATVQSRRWLAS